MVFKPTDFPWPVAPAISRWGIFARSAMNVSFETVFPKTKGSSNDVFLNFSEPSSDLIETISGFWLGTSIPMVPLPGIGAIIRIPNAERLKAMSSSRFLILEIRMPASGTISYKVTAGPIVALILAILIS